MRLEAGSSNSPAKQAYAMAHITATSTIRPNSFMNPDMALHSSPWALHLSEHRCA